jgi:SAM-dependent methyltransferase
MDSTNTNKQEYPEFFARFYDLIYHSIRSEVDTKFFLEQIKQTKGPVLEVGTGTGRFFREALHAGADIRGIDISPSMIAVLKSNIPSEFHHRVSVQNITGFTFDHKFDLVIAPFRVFMHLISVKDQQAALRNIYDHLNPGGRFIFDVFVPNLEIMLHGIDRKMDFEGEYAPGQLVRRITSSQSDLVNQLTHVTFRFEWQEKGQWKEKEWQTTLRLFFRYEIEHLVARSPLVLDYVYGAYDASSPLQQDSKDFIVACSRPAVEK